MQSGRSAHHRNIPPPDPQEYGVDCKSATDDHVCSDIKTLVNAQLPATELVIRDASLQFVREIRVFNTSSSDNELAFEQAIEHIASTASSLIFSLKIFRASKSRN